ncbi:MAG: hypothetical protein MI920_03455 [Kiloniellales bacterium]|nr:hypothetical protein [Kiloniellales bacterium]
MAIFLRRGLLLGSVGILAAGIATNAPADVPDVLSAQGGGAPAGYDTQHYQDPDYQPDQGLLSYNDPFAGQSDEALKAKVGPLNKQSVFNNAPGYNPNRGQGTAVERGLREIYLFTQGEAGKSGGYSPRGFKPEEWATYATESDIASADTFDTVSVERRMLYGSVERGSGMTPLDIIAQIDSTPEGRILVDLDQPWEKMGETQLVDNPTGTYLVGADFYWALERDGTKEYVAFLDSARPERQNAQSRIEDGLFRIHDSLSSVVDGGAPEFDSAAFQDVKENLARYRASVQQEQQILRPKLSRAKVNVGKIVTTLEEQAGSGLFDSGQDYSDPTLAGESGHTAMIDLLNDRLGVLEGVYTDTQRELNRVDSLLRQLEEMEQLNQSLYQRQTGLQCFSPCALGSLGLGISDYISRSAYYFAGRSPQGAAIYNAFGPQSQFDQRWIYEQSNGTMSPFDNRWINERSQGPISQFDHSWMYENGINPDSVQSWTQKFPSTNGLPGANPDDVFGGLSQSIVADLQGLDARLLLDEDMREQLVEQLSGKLVREFNIDPAVGEAIANGTLIGLTQQIQQMPGLLTGSGSTGGFTDITLELPLLFEVFDFATVDGDIITLRVTDQNGLQLGPINVTLSGPAMADLFAPNVQAGPIEISITAVNTGTFPPNTGEVNILSNITAGDKQQRFSLTTGETGILSITATPPP